MVKFDCFKKLETAAEDNRVCFLAIRAAENEAREILSAIENRLTSERRQDAARAAELEAQINDTTRPQTVRRMAENELSRLRGRNYGPTDEERELFGQSVAEVQTAINDAQRVRGELEELIRAAKGTILEILSRDHGLQLSPGATFRDALNARLLQLAETGDPKAREMVKKYGID